MWSAPDRSCLWNGMCVRCRSWCRSSAMRSWLSGSSASFSPQVEARLSVTASTQNPGAILLRFSIASTRCTVARSGIPSLLLGAMAVGGTEGVTADLGRHSRCANWYREQAPPTQLGPRSPDAYSQRYFPPHVLLCLWCWLPAGVFSLNMSVQAAGLHVVTGMV